MKVLFSYAVSLETLNRDRDIVDQDRLERREHLDHKRELEMVIPLKTDYPELWRQAFYELYGRNACINTDDIAAREAKELG